MLHYMPPPSMRAASATMISLPTCGAEGVVATAVGAGCVGLLMQLSLFAVFRKSKDPVLSGAPGYSAHQAIALVLMVVVSAFGLFHWLTPPVTAVTAAGRLLVPSDSARWLGAMLLGMLVAWDIPTSLWSGRLRKLDTLAHHIAMAAVALVGATSLPTRYGLYYMGVAELSSVALVAYEQSDVAVELASSSEAAVPPTRLEALRTLRNQLRALAAAGFVGIRAIDFTRVTLCHFVPDALSVLADSATAAAFRLPIRFMVGSSVGFVALQWYWLSLFVRISRAESKRQQKRSERRRRSADKETPPHL